MGQSIESRLLLRIDEMGRSIESRLMSRVDELGRSLDSRVDGLFDELNKNIDRIAEKIRDKPSEDSAPFDIQEGAAESGIGDIPVAGDDRMTYVTPAIEVHSGGLCGRRPGRYNSCSHQLVVGGEDPGEEEGQGPLHSLHC